MRECVGVDDISDDQEQEFLNDGMLKKGVHAVVVEICQKKIWKTETMMMSMMRFDALILLLD